MPTISLKLPTLPPTASIAVSVKSSSQLVSRGVEKFMTPSKFDMKHKGAQKPTLNAFFFFCKPTMCLSHLSL